MPTLLDRYTAQVINGLKIEPEHDATVHCVLGLSGESGEVADLHKKAQYKGQPPVNTDRVREELGDVLWYLTALAWLYGTSIEELAIANVTKLEIRRGAPYSVETLIGRQADRS